MHRRFATMETNGRFQWKCGRTEAIGTFQENRLVNKLKENKLNKDCQKNLKILKNRIQQNVSKIAWCQRKAMSTALFLQEQNGR